MLRIAAFVFMMGLWVAAVPAWPAAAQSEGDAAAVLVVLDVSGSMARDGQDGASLLASAKEAVTDLVSQLPDHVDVGLRLYGHRVSNDESQQAEGCQDTELVVPVGAADPPAVRAALDPLEPRGWTPIGGSLEAAGGDVAGYDAATVVLVSDGEDTCTPPDPCDVADGLQEQGVDVVVDTVGLLLDSEEAERQLSCIADATGGRFVTADGASELAEAFEQAASRAQRRFVATGEPIAGGSLPVEAPAMQPGASYVDEVRGDEVNFYAIADLGPGDWFDVEIVREQDPEASSGMIGEYFGTIVNLVDVDDDDFGPSSCCSRKLVTEPEIIGLRGVQVPDGVSQAFIKIETTAQNFDPGRLQRLQLRVVEVDPPEPPEEETSAPAPVPSDEETTASPTASESDPVVEPTSAEVASDGAAAGTPGWIVGLLVVLVLAVLGLGGWIVRLQRSIATGGSGTSRDPDAL